MTDWMRNVLAIAWAWSHDAWVRLRYASGLFTVGLVIALLGVGWDSTADAPVIFGATLTGYSSGRGPERVMTTVLNELFSWGWLLGFGLVILPGLLLPLSASFSTSQTLWLRLSGASARQVAAARAVRVFACSLVVAALAATWATAGGLRHQVPIGTLLSPVAGLVGHMLLAAGMVCLLAPLANGHYARQVIAFAGVLLPITLFLAYIAAFGRSDTEARYWWPYAAPFIYDSAVSNPARHAFSCIFVGFAMVVAPVLFCGGAIVRLPGNDFKSEDSQ